MAVTLLDIWQAAVGEVRGETAVQTALDRLPDLQCDLILSVGKAACDMARPAMARFADAPALIVTKHDHSAPLPRAARIIEAGHPIPDAASLEGGAALMDAVSNCASDTHLLLLVSGGASAVAELLPDGMTLQAWQAETEALVASGADIHAINRRRKEVSRIKGGKLVGAFAGASVTVMVVSDVEGDDLGVVGSGIGAAPDGYDRPYAVHMVATNHVARSAAAQTATEAGDQVIRNQECLYDDVTALAPRLGAILRDGEPGLYIFGGEPTVRLPAKPGRGGRNQALALEMAREIAGRSDLEILVAGTDGSDGPTGDAGGWVTGRTWNDDAADALTRADAGSYLAEVGALVTTGPTGTNVMDLMIVRKT